MITLIEKNIRRAKVAGSRYANSISEKELEMVRKYAELPNAFETVGNDAAILMVREMMPIDFTHEDAVHYWQSAGFDVLPEDYLVEAFVEGALEE